MNELKPCPFCGNSRKLGAKFHQAQGPGRKGGYDALIYCKECFTNGPKIRSEELGIPRLDVRNEEPTGHMKKIMREKAIEVWNRRAGI